MKIENRDRLNNIRGIAREMVETIDRILDSDRLFVSKEEASNV